MMEKKLAKPNPKLTRSSQRAESPAIPQPLAQWTFLSAAERNDIKNEVLAALNSLGIDGATSWWNEPGDFPHWQLVVQCPWCERHSRTEALTVRDQAIAAAKLKAPANGVILKGRKKEWR